MEQDIGTSYLSPNFSNDILSVSTTSQKPHGTDGSPRPRYKRTDSFGSGPPLQRPMSEGYTYAFASRPVDNYLSPSQRINIVNASPPLRPVSDGYGYASPPLRPLSINGSGPSTPRLRPRDSYSSTDLPTPQLPWIGTSARHSIDRATLSDFSLHVVKRNVPPIDQKKVQRWTKHKWFLLFSNTLLFIYSLACIVGCAITWGKFFLRADVIIISETLILTLTTVTAIITLVTAFFGYVGIMLNHRPILAIYNTVLWLCFAMIASVGYVAYRKAKWNLTGKLSYKWHREFNSIARSKIQANMHCCGYRDYTDYSEHSGKCYPRTLLPGCRYKFEVWTTEALWITWVVSFSVLPAHIFVIIVGLMCSNHVNKKFGKGLPPKLYRIKKVDAGMSKPSLMVRTPTPSIWLEQGPQNGLMRPVPGLFVRSPSVIDEDVVMTKLA